MQYAHIKGEVKLKHFSQRTVGRIRNLISNLEVGSGSAKNFSGSSVDALELAQYMIRLWHKVHLFLDYHSVCPLVGIGKSSPPLPEARVHGPPPEPKGGSTGNTLACG